MDIILNDMIAYNPDGFYTQAERDATTHLFMKGELAAHEIPFNLLPLTIQHKIMDDLKAFFPTPCPHCGAIDEAAFLTNIGMKHCQHCSAQTGYVPIVQLPDVDRIKAYTWQLCNESLDTINQLKGSDFDESWTGYWALYLKARNLNK